jgi:6-aminohexanoate-oligomer endohydrolase
VAIAADAPSRPPSRNERKLLRRSSPSMAGSVVRKARIITAVTRPTNDTLELAARTEFEGPTLAFDFPGIRIGIAEYAEGPTGCTVIHFVDGPVEVAVDVRGGSPGTVGALNRIDAICLAGGSAYGLEATTGVAAELLAQRSYSTAWTDVALVAGAIIFDFGRRDNAVYPDKALGRAALCAACEGVFPLGARGAGRSATVGKGIAYEQGEPAGQGAAFRSFGSTKLLVFCVVNAMGAILDRTGRVVRGNLADGQRLRYEEALARRLPEQRPSEPVPGNTTLTVVVTNQRLERRELIQFGRQVHDSISRAIQPFHALLDGDVLYAATTAEVENPALDSTALAVLASELAWDAVLSSFG